jgi:phosphoglycerate kinase
VALLENLRFHKEKEANSLVHKEKEANSLDFARALAEFDDIYVDDAFSAAHRAHASIDALARLLPNAAGKLMQAELTALTAALKTPKRPVLALIGGAKVSTKLDLLRFLVGKVDMLAIGGAMANTFLFLPDATKSAARCASATWRTVHAGLWLWRSRRTAVSCCRKTWLSLPHWSRVLPPEQWRSRRRPAT